MLASEQDRPDVARKRLRWKAHQGGVDLQRLVFSDETWTKTNMTPLRGWAVQGKRLIGKAPFGHWNTMTFVAALRHDGIVAPWVIDVPIDGETSRTYVEQVLVPALRPHDIVILDNLRISRRLSTDFARSWARVSGHLGQPFRGRGQADGFMESGLIGSVKRFGDVGPASEAFS